MMLGKTSQAPLQWRVDVLAHALTAEKKTDSHKGRGDIELTWE